MDSEMSAIRDFQGYVTSKQKALAGALGKEKTANPDWTKSEAAASSCDFRATGEASKAADSIEIRHDPRLVGGREMWMLPGTLSAGAGAAVAAFSSVLLSTSAPATEGSGDRPLHWRFWRRAAEFRTHMHTCTRALRCAAFAHKFGNLRFRQFNHDRAHSLRFQLRLAREPLPCYAQTSWQAG